MLCVCDCVCVNVCGYFLCVGVNVLEFVLGREMCDCMF